LASYLQAAQILLSTLLIVIILMQSRTSGLGSTFGSDSAVFRTRRGLEKTLFEVTLILATIFILLSIANVIVARS
jgi:preprotein translocase subunit SecG